MCDKKIKKTFFKMKKNYVFLIFKNSTVLYYSILKNSLKLFYNFFYRIYVQLYAYRVHIIVLDKICD